MAGKPETGQIKQVTIYVEGETRIEVDFVAFRDAFAGIEVEQPKGNKWRHTTAEPTPITYTATDNTNSGLATVPAAD